MKLVKVIWHLTQKAVLEKTLVLKVRPKILLLKQCEDFAFHLEDCIFCVT